MAYPDDPPTCERCGEEYTLEYGCEPTRYCNECAHEVVAELEQERDEVLLPDAERLQRLLSALAAWRRSKPVRVNAPDTFDGGWMAAREEIVGILHNSASWEVSDG